MAQLSSKHALYSIGLAFTLGLSPFNTMPAQAGGKHDMSTTASSMSIDEQIVAAQTHLAQKLSISVDDVELVSQQTVVWRSGAHGCPKPGVMYTQAHVPGIKLTFKAQQKRYQYHASTGSQPFHCPEGRVQAPQNELFER